MYLSFPSKTHVNIHDDKTGLVVSCNTVPEPIESGQVTGPDQFVIYTEKRVYVYRKIPRSNHFSPVQVRFKNI